jgi:hypothetical protein
MFHIPAKNPLEAETIGERRERKARESEGSILSSTSSGSFRDSRSFKAGTFNVFSAFSKSSKIPETPRPEQPLKIHVTQSVDVAAQERQASKDLISPYPASSGPLTSSRGFSELSASPSVSRPRRMNPAEEPGFQLIIDSPEIELLRVRYIKGLFP